VPDLKDKILEASNGRDGREIRMNDVRIFGNYRNIKLSTRCMFCIHVAR